MIVENGVAFVDKAGNTLRFENFRYEYPIGAHDYHDANWLHCTITSTSGITHSVKGFLLTFELQYLAETLRRVLAAPSTTAELRFEPMEPYIALRISRNESRNVIDILSRLDLHPALGPVVEFNFECLPSALHNTLADLDLLIADFPIRGKE